VRWRKLVSAYDIDLSWVYGVIVNLISVKAIRTLIQGTRTEGFQTKRKGIVNSRAEFGASRAEADVRLRRSGQR
jgi:hypothetical protein